MDPVKPIRRKKEKLCDHCKAVYTCSRKEHGSSPECNLGQMKVFFESIRSDPSEDCSTATSPTMSCVIWALIILLSS